MNKKIWFCKVGEMNDGVLPAGADLPMRNAISAAYQAMTGNWPDFCFSGWAGKLNEAERAVVENRQPDHDLAIQRSKFEQLMKDEGQDITHRADDGYEHHATHIAFLAWLRAIRLNLESGD